MNELLGTLKQSHFRAVPPAETGSLGPARVPVRVRMIDGKAVVVDAAVGGVVSGVPRGAIVTAVEGKPVADIVATAEGASMGAHEVAAALHGADGAMRQVTFLDPGKGDAEVTRAVKCVMPTGELVTIGNLHDLPTTVSHRMIKGTGVGYLAFNYWMLPLVKRVEAAMTELRAQGMKGLVLDLRGNPGGVGAMSIPVARMLLTQPGSLGKLQFREFAQEFNVAGNADAFTGPVVVLVDEDTASTSEIFAAGLRDLGRVQIYGSRASAGAALPSLIETLDGGGMLQYVVGDYHSSKGAVAEGDGVKPDVVVPETREGFVAGRDAVLDAAVKPCRPAALLPRCNHDPIEVSRWWSRVCSRARARRRPDAGKQAAPVQPGRRRRTPRRKAAGDELPAAETLLDESVAAMGGAEKFRQLSGYYVESNLDMGSLGLKGVAKGWWGSAGSTTRPRCRGSGR
jgi:carboxyl-terminal processing protease